MNYVSAQGFGNNSPAPGEGAERGRANEAAAREICLLTLNLGLPWLEMGGRWRVALAEHNQARLAAAPQLLSALDADVIALQEVYSPADRRFLAQAMAARYPFCAQAVRSRSLLGNGLMLLSRFPIVRSAFLPCIGAPWWLNPLWRQGFLLAEIELPGAGRTSLINVHLAANLPFGDAEATASERNRTREIGQLLAAASAQSSAVILIGDFNTSDQIYPANYRRILEAGYADAFVAVNGEARNGDDTFTWDAANPVNGQGRFRHAPSQRIDHVFVTTARQPALVPTSARVVLRDKSVRTANGERVCLSDHYGMLVALTQQSGAREIQIPLEEKPPAAFYPSLR